ncbi:MAG: iron-containing alcohol dehydrogenase [Smithellaceae bacterium]|nr:iron-containing alcohol dehydrogenase [Smithellaceae bacterium]
MIIYDSDLSFNYSGPTKVIFGAGVSRDVEVEIGSFGCSKAFLLTDPGIIKAGLVDGIKDALGKKLVGMYSDIPQDTGVGIVNKVAAEARKAGADCIISLGGGSVIDTGKCACIVLTEGGSLEDFEGIQLLTRWQMPHIVIPTTSGTGSEVTCMAVILDEKKGQKILIVEYYNTPRVAILDPNLTSKMPKIITASTGMDAMTHAVEALHAMQHEPISDGMAMHAIRLITKYLPTCCSNGSDITARGQMMLAATMAGWAFGNAMVGITHAMAHSIGAVARVPHGIANGILLADTMEFNIEDAAPNYSMVADAMGVKDRGMSDMDAAKAAVAAMRSFVKEIGHPLKLSEFGVKEADLVKAADLSMSDGSIVYNPRPVMDSSEILELYKKVF